MPSTIAVPIGNPTFQRCVENDLPRLACVRLCSGPDELRNTVRAGGVDLVLTDLYDIDGTPMIPVIQALRGERSALRVLFYVPASPPALEELCQAAIRELKFEIAFRPGDDIGHAIRRVLTWPSIGGAVRVLARDIVPLATTNTRAFTMVSALRPSAEPLVQWIAECIRVPERTLRGRFARAGLPTPRMVLSYCASLAAAWLLQVEGWPPADVALVLGLSGVAALNGHLQSSVGLTLEQARAPGAFPMLRDQIVRDLRRRRPRIA